MSGRHKEETVNKSERRMMMEAILNDHYDELNEPTELGCGSKHGFTFDHAMIDQLKVETETIKLEFKKGTVIETDLKREVLEQFGVEIFISVEEECKEEIANYCIKVEAPDNHTITHTKEQVCDEVKDVDFSEDSYMVGGGLMYPCPVCSNKYMHKENLGRHVKSEHEPSSQFKCDESDYVDDSYSRFKYHRRTQHKNSKALDDLISNAMSFFVNEGSRIWNCDFCNRTNKDKQVIKRHMEVHFQVQHQCRHCAKKVQTREALRKHIRRYHKHDYAVSMVKNTAQTV